MRLYIFEDRSCGRLEPFTLTRPVFDLWCGTATLLQRQQRAVAADEAAVETAVLVRPELNELCRLAHPELAINSQDQKNGTTVLVNARWLPPEKPFDDVHTPCIGLLNGQAAYLILPTGEIPECSTDTIDDWIGTWRDALPQRAAGGVMINYPWDLVEQNAARIHEDASWFRRRLAGNSKKVDMPVIGPAEQVIVHAAAEIEPLVVADTRNGPVLIDEGAVVQSFSRLEGPCYIGPRTWIVGGKVRSSTFGPGCRIGGEVEACIIQGYTNKYHDGFLGHSYLGEWVNLAAGTQVSDLRNDYEPIKVVVNGERIDTGLTKVGAFIGDHSKTGLATLLNSGTTVGAFSNLLPSGTYLPTLVPSFCAARYGQLQERTDLRQMFNTAATVMRRRGRELTAAHIDFFFNLYDATAAQRGKVIRDSERRRLRKSV